MNKKQFVWFWFWLLFVASIISYFVITNSDVARAVFGLAFFVGLPFGLTGAVLGIAWIYVKLGEMKK